MDSWFNTLFNDSVGIFLYNEYCEHFLTKYMFRSEFRLLIRCTFFTLLHSPVYLLLSIILSGWFELTLGSLLQIDGDTSIPLVDYFL
jgi:hypothetical protein